MILAPAEAPEDDAEARPRATARDRLLAAAAEQFCTRGYLAVTVEEIAAAAGVSRVTFYRQFAGKVALTTELFRAFSDRAMPRFAEIGRLDYRDRAVVAAWIGRIFAADQTYPGLLRAFTEALVVAPDFLVKAQQFTDRLIAELGKEIPAFDADRDDPASRRQWAEAWLLLYEILDRSNHAALGLGIAPAPLIIEILTDRFLAFVARYDR